MPRPPGSAVGRYQILGFIARGETTVVYRAQEPELGREVALKILPPSVARDPQAARDFLRQADRLARLDHENVLPVLDYGREGDVPFVASPIAEGGSLQEDMSAYRSIGAALSLVASLAGALDYLHRHGLIHGRLGPRHILFDDRDKPLLTGFGHPFSAGDRGLVPAYVAPEQRRGQPPDRKTDIYQLGALLYDLLLAGPPQPDQDIQADPRIADLSDDIQAILFQALAQAPEERFQLAGDMADLLALAAQRHGTPPSTAESPPDKPPAVAPEPAEAQPSPPAPPPSRNSRETLWLAVAAIGLAFALTLCCLSVIFAAISIGARLRQPRATAQVDTNVRSGPSVEYEIVGVLREGQETTVYGVSPDSRWWQIAFDPGPGGRGWVPAAFIIVEDVGNVDVITPPTLTPLPSALVPAFPRQADVLQRPRRVVSLGRTIVAGAAGAWRPVSR